MELRRLGLRDTIRLHRDLSWERTVIYRGRDGLPVRVSENGQAALVETANRVRVLKFEPFTFVFEELLPDELTYIRPPSKALNTMLYLQRQGGNGSSNLIPNSDMNTIQLRKPPRDRTRITFPKLR